MTGTGLDFILTALAADPGLTTVSTVGAQARKVAQTIKGLEAASVINGFINEAIVSTGVAADGLISVEDVASINAWIRADPARLSAYTAAHGDDEGGVETGYHLIQGDGGVTQYDGLNFANRVVDGIYHIGFEVKNGRFVNEDGNLNAKVSDVASWLNYFYLHKNDVVGTAGNDTYVAGQSDILFKGAEADIYHGYAGNDLARGGGGDDVLYGDDGNDSLYGEAGNDTLVGGAGNDILTGGAGSDLLDGGGGRDQIVLEADGERDVVVVRPGDTGKTLGAADIIAGFEHGVDRLDLSAFGKMVFSASSTFSGRGAEAVFVAGNLLIDANADKVVDAVIVFQGLANLSGADFVFG
jgi:Ca2+-binding RTX toxin-like protein